MPRLAFRLHRLALGSGLGLVLLTGLACGGGGSASASSDSPGPSTPAPDPGAPLVCYADLASGPTSGGEHGKGTFLSIFGKRFGTGGLGSRVRVYLGDSEIDNYRYLGPSKGRPDIQQITVQVGALGGAAQGHALPVKVMVDGVASNTDVTFTPNPGHIYFVDNVHGDDATGAPDDPSHPYRHVQTPALYTGGVWPLLHPGDILVLRGTGTPWTDVGFEGYFLRFRDKSGSAPMGAEGTGPIAVMGYPGEDAYIRGTLAGGMTGGGISAINGETYPGLGQWAVVADLRLDVEGYDGPISQEIHGDHWRVVNNDLAASTAPTSGPDAPRMGGITGNGEGSVWLGNHIHDIQGSEGEAHGLYIDGDGSYEIAYNLIERIRSGNGFQIYVNGTNGSLTAGHVNLHHNLIHDVSKHGINLADGAREGIRIWDNLVYNATYAAVRFNTLDLTGAQIAGNTFYATDLSGASNYGALTNTWTLPSGALSVKNNLFVVASGTPYISGTVGITAAQAALDHNLWFNGSGDTSLDAHPVLSDPAFVAPGSDFHLRSGSPALGAGLEQALVPTDYELLPRTHPPDLGALGVARP